MKLVLVALTVALLASCERVAQPPVVESRPILDSRPLARLSYQSWHVDSPRSMRLVATPSFASLSLTLASDSTRSAMIMRSSDSIWAVAGPYRARAGIRLLGAGGGSIVLADERGELLEYDIGGYRARILLDSLPAAVSRLTPRITWFLSGSVAAPCVDSVAFDKAMSYLGRRRPGAETDPLADDAMESPAAVVFDQPGWCADATTPRSTLRAGMCRVTLVDGDTLTGQRVVLQFRDSTTELSAGGGVVTLAQDGDSLLLARWSAGNVVFERPRPSTHAAYCDLSVKGDAVDNRPVALP